MHSSQTLEISINRQCIPYDIYSTGIQKWFLEPDTNWRISFHNIRIQTVIVQTLYAGCN